AKILTLDTLVMNNNQIIALPSNLCSLSNLQRLFVANNKLTEIPETFNLLRRLNAFNLSNNQLACFTINIPTLKKLGLNGNLISSINASLLKSLYHFEKSQIQSTEEVLSTQ